MEGFISCEPKPHQDLVLLLEVTHALTFKKQAFYCHFSEICLLDIDECGRRSDLVIVDESKDKKSKNVKTGQVSEPKLRACRPKCKDGRVDGEKKHRGVDYSMHHC